MVCTVPNVVALLHLWPDRRRTAGDQETYFELIRFLAYGPGAHNITFEGRRGLLSWPYTALKY